ncbi:MAG: hypothetical protein IJU72_05490 [Bacteroidales bacterium]|nr:hypothetical protein [Bacteroidales bacterium]
MDKEKFPKAELTPEEQKEFKGGMLCAEVRADDVINENAVHYCKCTYNNRSAISNKNGVEFCECVCI